MQRLDDLALVVHDHRLLLDGDVERVMRAAHMGSAVAVAASVRELDLGAGPPGGGHVRGELIAISHELLLVRGAFEVQRYTRHHRHSEATKAGWQVSGSDGC